jgi:hypothetical protein
VVFTSFNGFGFAGTVDATSSAAIGCWVITRETSSFAIGGTLLSAMLCYAR